jgi:hypothetical protein
LRSRDFRLRARIRYSGVRCTSGVSSDRTALQLRRSSFSPGVLICQEQPLGVPTIPIARSARVGLPRLNRYPCYLNKQWKLPSKRHDYGRPQSAQASSLIRANSDRFAVINVSLFRIACPAIKRSYAPIGFPMDSRSARIAPAISAS